MATSPARLLIVALLTCGLWLAGPGRPSAAAAQSALESPAFRRLFDGTMKGWSVENTDAGNFSIRDGLMRVEGPSGWLRSEGRYEDFDLRVEFRFLTADADSGIFVRAPGTGAFMRGWPNNSYQVQLRVPSTPSRLPPVGGIFRHGMPPGANEFDAALVEKLFTGVNQWQTVGIEVSGDTLAVRFNGTEVTRAASVVPSSGFIGIQGETGALEYRTIDIRER